MKLQHRHQAKHSGQYIAEDTFSLADSSEAVVSSGSDEVFPANKGFELKGHVAKYHSDNESQPEQRTSDTIRQYAMRARKTSSYSALEDDELEE